MNKISMQMMMEAMRHNSPLGPVGPAWKLTPEHLERMAHIKVLYLDDATRAIAELLVLIKCHPNAYRKAFDEGDPEGDVERRLAELAELSALFFRIIQEEGSSLERIISIKARHLQDAIGAFETLGCMIEWHPESYRALRGYCHPQIEITRRISELVWLISVFNCTITGETQAVVKLEQAKDVQLSTVQPCSEEFCCDADWESLQAESLRQEDADSTHKQQMIGKMLCDGQRAVGLLLRALGAYGEERGPYQLDRLLATAKETWEEYLGVFDQNREQWYQSADEVYYRVLEPDRVKNWALDVEIHQLKELAKAKGYPLVATELKISLGTLIGWIENWFSPGKANLEKIRSLLKRNGS
jgi:hypothetical protein